MFLTMVRKVMHGMPQEQTGLELFFIPNNRISKDTSLAVHIERRNKFIKSNSDKVFFRTYKVYKLFDLVWEM